jgi:hypothetical protein
MMTDEAGGPDPAGGPSTGAGAAAEAEAGDRGRRRERGSTDSARAEFDGAAPCVPTRFDMPLRELPDHGWNVGSRGELDD